MAWKAEFMALRPEIQMEFLLEDRWVNLVEESEEHIPRCQLAMTPPFFSALAQAARRLASEALEEADEVSGLGKTQLISNLVYVQRGIHQQALGL